MKRILKYAPSVCGFNTVFFTDIDSFSSVEDVKGAVADVTKHKEEQFFESYGEAQEHLMKTLQDDNDYYFGIIVMVWYDYVSNSGNTGVGECRAYTCVAEAWAEDEVN